MTARHCTVRLGILLVSLFLQTLAYADYAAFEEQAIELAKATPTSEIEQGMPAQPFEAWLQSLAGAGAELKWELNDCGEGTGGPADQERDMPLCVSVNAALPDGRWLDVSLGVAHASDLGSGHPPDGVGMRGVAAGYQEAPLVSGDGPGPALFKLQDFLKVDIRSLVLYYASARGDVTTAQALLKQGVDIHSGYGRKAMFAAVENGQLPMVQLLLDAGADVNNRLAEDTALSAATAWHGQYYPVETLALTPSPRPPASPEYIVAGGVVYPLREKSAYSGYAVGWDSYFEIVRLLIAKGADAYSKNMALENASSRQSPASRQLDIVRLLLKAGADVNYLDKYRSTPLMRAAGEKNIEVVRLLLEAGADANASSGESGETPLTSNIKHNGSEEILRTLLEHGASARPKSFEPPLVSAVQVGATEKVRMLLDHGADINATAPFTDSTPLMLAATYGHLGMAKMLIEKAADLNRRDRSGSTALSLAIKNRHPQIANLLRNAGAKR